jgi:hypothetical protein
MDFYVYYSFEVRGFREEELPSIFNHMKTAIQLSKVATLWFYSPCLKPFYHIVPPLFLFMCAVIFSRMIPCCHLRKSRHKRLRRFMYYTTFLWRSTPPSPSSSPSLTVPRRLWRTPTQGRAAEEGTEQGIGEVGDLNCSRLGRMESRGGKGAGTLRPHLAQLLAPDSSQVESGELCQTLQNQEK